MSLYSLDTLSKDGAIRLSVEFVVVFAGFTLVYLIAVEPLLQSIAPDVYVQTGLEYRSGYDFPNTATEMTHILFSLLFVGPFLYWRVNYTELGQRLKDDIKEDI